MSRSAQALAALAWIAAIAAGCSSSPFDNTLLYVQVDSAGLLSANGSYTVGVTLSNMTDGHCPLSPSAILTVGDQTAPMGEQSWPFGSCFVGNVPLPGNNDLNIKVWDAPNSGDQGQAVVGALTPGGDATIASPLSGTTTPGGQILVSVPDTLRSLQPTLASFVYLGTDDPRYAGENTFPTYDGEPLLTVPAPQHTGRFRFTVTMTSSDASLALPAGVVVSCFGISECVAIGTPDIGPLQITVAAPAP